MNCKEMEAQWLDVLDVGAVGGRATEEIAEHLRTCEACAVKLNELQEVNRWFKAWEDVPPDESRKRFLLSRFRERYQKRTSSICPNCHTGRPRRFICSYQNERSLQISYLISVQAKKSLTKAKIRYRLNPSHGGLLWHRTGEISELPN